MERKIAISNTDFVVALLNKSDVKHRSVLDIYQKYEQILLPQTISVEC
jgi:hypothetical protein